MEKKEEAVPQTLKRQHFNKDGGVEVSGAAERPSKMNAK